jgi:Dynamin family
MQTEDGLYVRRLPSELLRRVNVVDTPGTNVVVDRQQRLTEEFVPRSDLVLFILSADRPLTESEARASCARVATAGAGCGPRLDNRSSQPRCCMTAVS